MENPAKEQISNYTQGLDGHQIKVTKIPLRSQVRQSNDNHREQMIHSNNNRLYTALDIIIIRTQCEEFQHATNKPAQMNKFQAREFTSTTRMPIKSQVIGNHIE